MSAYDWCYECGRPIAARMGRLDERVKSAPEVRLWIDAVGKSGKRCPKAANRLHSPTFR